MQRKTVGRQILEIFTPIMANVAVSLVVEFFAMSVYSIYYFAKNEVVVTTQQELYDHMLVLTEQFMQYAIEIGAVSALLTLPILIYMMKKDRKYEAAIGYQASPKAPLAKYVLVAGISIPVALAANNILLLVNISEYSKAYQESADMMYSSSFLVQIIGLGIIYPIMEECIFRGLVYRRMRISVSMRRAIISSSLFFGIYHGNSVQLIYGAIMGALFAYLYEKFGSLKAPILAHILANILSVLLTELNGFVWMFEKPIRMAVITIACAAVASTVFLFIQNIQKKPEEDMLQNC